MNWKSRSRRCAMFARSPVRRLSMPITEKPRSSSVSERCDPMNPAAPVMTTRGMFLPVWLVGVLAVSGVLSWWSGAIGSKHANQRKPHDLDVERDRPVLDVIQVVFDALLERRVAPPAVDLRPAGDAGL